jgi:type III restriction enzyme
VLDPYNPKGSMRHVNFITSKPCWKTGAQPPKSHISHVVLDSSWEEQLALTLEIHPSVLAYAKNQALGFEIPYLDSGITRRYLPDFLVRLDDGGDEPLNLVLEVKGIKDESDKAKAQTTRDLWVSGVNAVGGDRNAHAFRRATHLAWQGPSGLDRPRCQCAAALHPGEDPPQGDHRRPEAPHGRET